MLIGLIFILMSSQVTADNDRLQKEPDHLYICTFNVYILGNVEAKYTDYESIGDEVIDPNVVPQRIKNLANVLAVGNFDLVCIQEVTAGEKGEWAVGDLVRELEETHNIEYRYFLSDEIGPGYGITEAFAYLYNSDVVNPELPTGKTSYAVNIEVSGRNFVRTQWRSGDFDFTLVSVHLAWGNEADREAGYEMVKSILTTTTPSQFSHDPDIIVLGDFNRFGGYMNSVTVMDFQQGDFLAPNITFFDPDFDEIEEVTKTSIQGKGVPGNNPQLLSTTVAQNKFVYDMILLSMDVSEEFPKGSDQAEYNIDFGIIYYDEPNEFGYQNNAETLSHNNLKKAYSDHRPLWMRFRTDTNNEDNTPSGLEPIPSGVTYMGTEHGKKFHLPGCRTIKNKTITKTWSSREDGLRERSPCGVCKP